MYTQISAAALFAGLAAAYHAPVGNPTGNPITRPLNEIVPACKDFTITWQPTTTNNVALVLLKGPSTNVVPVSAIVENIANSGSYTWSVPSGLEATTDATGYGLQIIDEVNGQYQYSTQFGINNDACKNQVSSKPSTPSSTPAGYPVSTPAGYPVSTPAETKISTPAGYPVSTPAAANSTTLYTATSKPVVPPVYSTGAPVHNSSVVLPTKSMSVPSSLQYSATGSVPSGTATPPPESTGAASSLKAGLGLAGAVAGLVFML